VCIAANLEGAPSLLSLSCSSSAPTEPCALSPSRCRIERERERDQVRRMSLHKEEKHPCAIRAEPTQPTLQQRQEGTRKKGTMFSQKFTNSSATLHPYLRRPSFLTDNVQMLPIADSSFPHPAHIVSQKQVQVEHGSIDALDVSIMNSRVPSASIDECLH